MPFKVSKASRDRRRRRLGAEGTDIVEGALLTLAASLPQHLAWTFETATGSWGSLACPPLTPVPPCILCLFLGLAPFPPLALCSRSQERKGSSLFPPGIVPGLLYHCGAPLCFTSPYVSGQVLLWSTCPLSQGCVLQPGRATWVLCEVCTVVLESWSVP